MEITVADSSCINKTVGLSVNLASSHHRTTRLLWRAVHHTRRAPSGSVASNPSAAHSGSTASRVFHALSRLSMMLVCDAYKARGCHDYCTVMLAGRRSDTESAPRVVSSLQVCCGVCRLISDARCWQWPLLAACWLTAAEVCAPLCWPTRRMATAAASGGQWEGAQSQVRRC